MEWERVITHLGMALFGALVTLGGALFTFLRKNRESEVAAGVQLRKELQKELTEVKEKHTEVLEIVDALKEERLMLKRALDKRDLEIGQLRMEQDALRHRQDRLDHLSEPEGL